MKNKIIFGFFILVLAAGVGYYIWHDLKSQNSTLHQNENVGAINNLNPTPTPSNSTPTSTKPTYTISVPNEEYSIFILKM